MDAYFASVEQLDHPHLRGKPVIVGGSPSGRGVVSAASYEARKFGVKSAMPSHKAKQLCPEAIFVKGRFERYIELSKQIREIFYRVTDLVEPLSLDEAYLDVTRNKLELDYASEIAKWLKKTIKSETGLTASAGVGPNKFVAKIASDINKPNGLCVVPPSKVREFIEPLPIERMWGVGPATAKKFRKLGIYRIKDIKQFTEDEMKRAFGKSGPFFWNLAHGNDFRKVKNTRIVKSKGVERTFSKNLSNIDEIRSEIERLVDELNHRFKKYPKKFKTISLKIRFSDFKTITRSKTFYQFTNDLAQVKRETLLLLDQVDMEEGSLRLLGVSLSHFQNEESLDNPVQLIFDFPKREFHL